MSNEKSYKFWNEYFKRFNISAEIVKDISKILENLNKESFNKIEINKFIDSMYLSDQF